MSQSITIAVTGGIATGKSTWSSLVADASGAPLLSCDAVVHDLYDDPRVCEELGQRYGGRVFEENRLNRAALGEIAFSDAAEREWLEGLLHPLVLEKVVAWREAQKSPCALIEVPLLYEVDFPLKRDIDVVVACSPETQLSRIRQRNQLDLEQAKARIAAQAPIAEKIKRAHVVIWNEASESLLARQANLAAFWISTLTK